MIEKLSKNITSKGELRALGIRGLHMEAQQVERHLEDSKGDIVSAVFKVLMEWRTGQGDPASAYERLREGLLNSNLNIHIQLLKSE